MQRKLYKKYCKFLTENRLTGSFTAWLRETGKKFLVLFFHTMTVTCNSSLVQLGFREDVFVMHVSSACWFMGRQLH